MMTHTIRIDPSQTDSTSCPVHIGMDAIPDGTMQSEGEIGMVVLGILANEML